VRVFPEKSGVLMAFADRVAVNVVSVVCMLLAFI
jgi:hypothetical protein